MTSGSIVLGLINGLLIGLLAVGLVLVYKSNRFLNLAQAQMGAFSVVLLGKLVLDSGWNWWAAFCVCVPVGMAVGAIVDRLVIRPLREKSPSAVALLLLSIGVSQILLVFAYLRSFSPSQAKLAVGYPQPFHAAVHVGGVVLRGADLLTLILVPLLVGGLALFLRYSLFGKTMRAAASNSDAARLCGVSTRAVSLAAWAIAGGLAAIAGILQAPSLPLFNAAALGPFLLLLGLGAAAFGAFTSLPLALVGGLVMGLVDQLVLATTSNPSQAELAVLVTIVVIVLARGRAIGQVFSGGGISASDRPRLHIPASLIGSPLVRYRRVAPALFALALGLILPLLPVFRSEGHRFQIALILVYALVAVSLTIAIGWAGQVSLGQFALVGCGGFVAGHLIAAGWSLPIVLLVSGAVSAGFMALIGLPALRVPGLTLAVTTLGFAVVAPDWLFHQSWFGTTHTVGLDLPVPAMPAGLGRPHGELFVCYVALAVVAITIACLFALRGSGPGRLLIAVRDNESASSAFGITPATVKVAALSLSGFVVGMAGALWADAWRTLAPTQFTPDISISILAIPVIGGIGSLGGAVAAAGIIYGFIFFISPHVGGLFTGGSVQVAAVLMLGGVGLVLTVRRYPQGIAGAVQDRWQRFLDTRAQAAELVREAREKAPGLVVKDVLLAFGGASVLNGVSIDVHPGEIVGLIGPNGAGKTTLLNVISGKIACQSGEVCLNGVDLTGFDPEIRAGYGLGRSFQDGHLFPGLTVTEMIQVASFNRHRVGYLSSLAAAPWVRETEGVSRAEAEAIVERLGLSRWSDALTAELSTGTRRICDLAAQIASRPSVLLLDEPTAGVAQREAEAFGPLLRRIREELECAILIVEHDMPLLMGLCDRIYAMETGQILACGTPGEIRSNAAVIASYLGTNEVAIGRSGDRAATRPSKSRARSRKQLAGGAQPQK